MIAAAMFVLSGPHFRHCHGRDDSGAPVVEEFTRPVYDENGEAWGSARDLGFVHEKCKLWAKARECTNNHMLLAAVVAPLPPEMEAGLRALPTAAACNFCAASKGHLKPSRTGQGGWVSSDARAVAPMRDASQWFKDEVVFEDVSADGGGASCPPCDDEAARAEEGGVGATPSTSVALDAVTASLRRLELPRAKRRHGWLERAMVCQRGHAVLCYEVYESESESDESDDDDDDDEDDDDDDDEEEGEEFYTDDDEYYSDEDDGYDEDDEYDGQFDSDAYTVDDEDDEDDDDDDGDDDDDDAAVSGGKSGRAAPQEAAAAYDY